MRDGSAIAMRLALRLWILVKGGWGQSLTCRLENVGTSSGADLKGIILAQEALAGLWSIVLVDVSVWQLPDQAGYDIQEVLLNDQVHFLETC